MRVKYLTGHRCMYCGAIFGIFNGKLVHGPTIEFVNGYPTPCRMTGQRLDQIEDGDDVPWLVTATEWAYR